MALANRKHNKRIFTKTGNGSLKMADDKIAKISQSFASNVHIDAPETPDAAQAMIYAIQGIEEDVEELHRYLKSPTLVATNITASGNISSSGTITANAFVGDITGDLTGNALTATALTAGNKTLDGNFTIDTGHSLTAPFIYTNQISPISSTNDDLIITSNGDMKFTLDSNTNETGQSFTFRNHTGYGNYTDMLTLDESGHFTLFGAAAGDPLIKLHQNTNSSTSGPPILEFFRNSSTSDNSNLGLIQFKGRNSSGTEKSYAEISGITEESGTGTEGGKLEFKIASHDGEIVTGLKIEDGNAEDEIDITIGSGTNSLTNVAGNLKTGGSIELGHASDTTIARSASGEVTIEGKKIVTENYVKHVMNCGWVGHTNSRQYLPFGYGGTSTNTNPAGWSEFGAFIAPCNGTVDSVIIRSETACGNSTVGIHIVGNGTEMPSFNPGTGVSDTVNMSQDDTSYKFGSFDGQYASNLNVFTAGQIIVVSFDPTGYPSDSIATMILNLDWTNTL